MLFWCSGCCSICLTCKDRDILQTHSTTLSSRSKGGLFVYLFHSHKDCMSYWYALREEKLCLISIGISFISLVWIWMLNVTFNNILVISWRSILLVGETRVPGVNHRPVANLTNFVWQTLSLMFVSITPRYERDSNSQL